MKTMVLEPKDMEWVDKGVLGIQWSDGHKAVYPVHYLRQHCPCAACTDEWTGELRLNPDDVPLLIRVNEVEPVGRYALRFKWSDGHDSGIYSFAFLRRICQCDVCQPVKTRQPKSKRLLQFLLFVPILVMTGACMFPRIPPLAEQKAQIMNEEIRVNVLTRQAFLETWGPARYEHRQHTQFYPVKGGSWVPQFRVPIGEAPLNWDLSVNSEVGHFLGYPDRGVLLGFIENRLVYREKLSPEEVHAIGAAWKRDTVTRTTLEKSIRTSP